MSQAAALARIFGECREGRCVPAAHVQRRPKWSADQIPRPLGPKEQARPCPVAYCGVFDYHGISGQFKCVIDRFYAAAYLGRPPHLKKAAMFLNSGDADMYDGAMFSFKGDFVGYLDLENMGVFTAHGSENSSPEKLRELREFGASLR